MFKRQLIFWVTFLHCSTHLQTRTRSLFKCFLEWEKIGNQVEVRAGSHGKGRSKNSFWSVLSTLFIWKWPFSNPTKYTLFAPKALSTLPRCPRNASIDSRPHYRFNAFSTVLTRTSENAPVIFSVTVFISIRFLSSTLLQMYAFSFWSLSRAFSNWFVSNGNTLVHCVQILYKTLFGGGGWGANRVYYGDSKIENTHRDF